MPLYVLISALAVVVSIPLLVWSLASDRRQNAMVKASRGAGSQLTDTRQIVLEEGAMNRVVLPAVRSMGLRLRRLTPASRIRSLQRNLGFGGRYGDTYALERLLVMKFLLGGTGFVVSVFLFSNASGLLRVIFTALLTGAGFVLPDALVARRGRKRQEQIELDMPDTLDQVTMALEAGLGFEAALSRTARVGSGPLAEELNRTLREIQLGIPREQALRKLADRTDVADLDSLVLAVVQSERYGLGIGQVLRVQSEELRERRRQRAEEQALKIPVKIIFPLVFCIFPAVFIVLLAPAVISGLGGLGSIR
jgi:tight adherence protein C